MSGKRLNKKVLGSLTVLFAVILMIGTAGAVESGSVSIAAAFLRLTIGCILILFGAAGYLE